MEIISTTPSKTVPRSKIWLVYLAGLLLAIHFASVTYINSSLLKRFVGDGAVSALYALGSLLSILFLFLMPRILRKRGSVFAFLFFIALEIFAVFGMGSSSTAAVIIILFLLHIAGDSVLYLCLDVNMEEETKSEGTTGGKRGALLEFENIAWTLSPLALIFLVNKSSFSGVYLLSGAILIPLFIIVMLFFKNTRRSDQAQASIIASLNSLRHKSDEARVMAAQFLLNFFYSWMIIYMPLVLNEQMGFSWPQIGMIFSIMLLPYLLFELPIGILADRKYGETEIMTIGFIVMAFSTAFIPFIHSASFWLWAATLFVTRIGATLVEMSSESYFFKHVKEENTGIMSLFRTVRPLSYTLAPLIAFPIVFFTSYSASFYFLALFTSLGLFFIPRVDTK